MSASPFFRSCFVLLVFSGLSAGASGILDSVQFGEADSENAHGFSGKESELIAGGLGDAARRLLAPQGAEWQGGRMEFSLKVDPEAQNYVTVKFWGSDTNPNRLILFVDGKQMGYRHLGDFDILDIGDKEPAYNGRFYYTTTPLPLELTKGKKEVRLEVMATGPIYGYGGTFEKYQRLMEEPSRGIYAAYTHGGSRFTPPAIEKQGEAAKDPPVRKVPGPEVMERLKERIVGETEGQLKSTEPPGQQQMQFLARSYHVPWSPAYQNPKVLSRVVAGADAHYLRFRADPSVAINDSNVPNPDWLGSGMVGEAIKLLAGPLQPMLDEKIEDGRGGRVVRRAAWAEFLKASVEHNRRTRREYTNQTMIKDLYLYLANAGLAELDPTQALPESQTLRYLHEAVGIEPWLGPEGDNGPTKPLGENFYQITAKGLTKELGYVGYYGEVLDWVTHIYNATCEPGKPDSGDAKIKEQLKKMERARAYFRYPMLDAEGNRAMRIETIIGWRDSHYPGEVCYGERSAWEGSAIYSAAATRDAHSVGYTQQMFADNQFFKSLEGLVKQGGQRVSNTLLVVPGQYETLAAEPPSPHRLPMTEGQPDFAWADEENGVLAIKNGDNILFISLYWRARFGLNSLARVHDITPRYDRVAVVRQQCEFDDSGMVFRRPNWVNFGFGNGGIKYPGKWQSAHEGEVLPIAKIPDGLKFKPGDENIHAGKAAFYVLRYGDYLIGMNTTADRTFSLTIPEGQRGRPLPELVSGKTVTPGASAPVKPRSTLVFHLK